MLCLNLSRHDQTKAKCNHLSTSSSASTVLVWPQASHHAPPAKLPAHKMWWWHHMLRDVYITVHHTHALSGLGRTSPLAFGMHLGASPGHRVHRIARLGHRVHHSNQDKDPLSVSRVSLGPPGPYLRIGAVGCPTRKASDIHCAIGALTSPDRNVKSSCPWNRRRPF